MRRQVHDRPPGLPGMAAQASDPRTSLVLQVPAAEPIEAEAHFLRKLSFETDPSDVQADLSKGVAGLVVLDCRSAEKYAAGHVPGAVSMPYRTMTPEATAKLSKDVTYVTYCSSWHCNASTKGALRLATLGYRVKEMLGGMAAWTSEGYEVATGTTPGKLAPAQPLQKIR